MVASSTTPSTAWRKLLKERALMFTDKECELPRSIVSEDGFQDFVKVVLSNSSSGERMMLIKTLINSWSTSRRLHEPTIHPCLCCGEYEDDLSHYLNCTFLWSIIISSANLSVNLVSLPPSPGLECLHLIYLV